MGKDHRGQPSGTNRVDSETGVPAGGKYAEDMEMDQRITEEYTQDEERVADHVREMHPNRNTDKDNSANKSGYTN